MKHFGNVDYRLISFFFVEPLRAPHPRASSEGLPIVRRADNVMIWLRPDTRFRSVTCFLQVWEGRSKKSSIPSVVRKPLSMLMKGATDHLADDLRRDKSESVNESRAMWDKILDTGRTAMNMIGIIHEQLCALSNTQLEKFVYKKARSHLRDFKNATALIGIIFGIFSALLFG